MAQETARYRSEAGRAIGIGLGEIAGSIHDVGEIAQQHIVNSEKLAARNAAIDLLTHLGNQHEDAVRAYAAGNPDALEIFKNSMEDQLDHFTSAPQTEAGRVHAGDLALGLKHHFAVADIAEQGRVASETALLNFGQSVN